MVLYFHHFFDENIPLYHLAKCDGYEQTEPKYHNYGTIVESVTDNQERLVNLYEYFMLYPDNQVTSAIIKYINYCLEYYDYSFFFKSELLKKHPEIAAEISKQILYSILRGDQNYHYENVSFIYNGNQLARVAMPIDHEFSNIFMYLDENLSHLALCGRHLSELLDISQKNSKMAKNIETIVRLYPDVVANFITSLKNLEEELQSNQIILEDHEFLEPFSSRDYEVGILRYKDKDLERALKREKEIEKREVNVDEVNEHLNQEILTNASFLKKTLENKLTAIH